MQERYTNSQESEQYGAAQHEAALVGQMRIGLLIDLDVVWFSQILFDYSSNQM